MRRARLRPELKAREPGRVSGCVQQRGPTRPMRDQKTQARCHMEREAMVRAAELILATMRQQVEDDRELGLRLHDAVMDLVCACADHDAAGIPRLMQRIVIGCLQAADKVAHDCEARGEAAAAREVRTMAAMELMRLVVRAIRSARGLEQPTVAWGAGVHAELALPNTGMPAIKQVAVLLSQLICNSFERAPPAVAPSPLTTSEMCKAIGHGLGLALVIRGHTQGRAPKECGKEVAAALGLVAKAAHDVVAMQQGDWEQEQRQKEEPSSHAIN